MAAQLVFNFNAFLLTDVGILYGFSLCLLFSAIDWSHNYLSNLLLVQQKQIMLK